MKRIYEKIVILKVEILESDTPVDEVFHQTTMHVIKEMSSAEYQLLIETMNFLDKVKQYVEGAKE